MKNIKTYSYYVWFQFLFTLFLTAPLFAQTGMHIPQMTALDASIEQFISTWGIPGGSVAVAKNGRLVYARGFGFSDVTAADLVQPTSRFRIASLSKPITATAIYQMVEQGLISLDDNVFGTNGILNDSSYLPLLDARFANITIKHLLGHQAGTNRFGDNVDPMFSSLLIADAINTQPPASSEDIITFMTQTQRLEYSPGFNQIYSNFGFNVLGRVIEKVSGVSYETYVQNNIMGLVDAPSFSITKNLFEDRQTNEVQYYDLSGAPLYPSIYGTGELLLEQYGGSNIEAMDSHGGWISSATDMLKFALAIDGFSTRPDIINQNSIQTMRSLPINFTSFGHGIHLYAGGAFHFGLLPGSSAELDLNDNGQIVFVALFNGQSYQNTFLNSLDAAMWNGLSAITNWPTHNLFDSLSSVSDQWENKPVAFEVFPNPTRGVITLNFGDTQQHIDLEIRNALGKFILKQHIQSGDNLYLNREEVPGVYFIYAKAKGLSFIPQKLILN